MDVPVFSKETVRHMLFLAGLDPDDLSDANLAQIGIVSTKTQLDRVMAAYEASSDVNVIFETLGQSIPKSSIRAYLCQAVPNGDWRQRRRRVDSGRSATSATAQAKP
jgi:hypothetical protein